MRLPPLFTAFYSFYRRKSSAKDEKLEKKRCVFRMSRSPEVTHKIMSAVHSKETRPEVALRRELWRRGLRYRKNDKRLPGKPDIVLSRAKLAVFCDGDFWHGHNWAIRGYGSLEQELKRYSKPWADKILRNIHRDQVVNQALKSLGWRVLRIWESDIKKDVKRCGNMVEYAYWRAIRNSDFNEAGEYDEYD